MEKNKEAEYASPYDYFYYDLSIFKQFLDINEVRKFALNELNIDLSQNLKGVSYILEILLINMTHHLELMVENINVQDILQWSHCDISEEAVRGLRENQPLIRYIFDMNELRKEFVKLRTKNKLSEKVSDNLITLIRKFDALTKEINEFLLSSLGIERLENNANEKTLILHWFLVKYNYIESHNEEGSPTYPGGDPFFYTMPNKTRRSYYLQNPLITKHNQEYLNGYKSMLLYFYKHTLAPNYYVKIKQKNLDANSWNDLHKIYGIIIRLTEKPSSLFSSLFKINKQPVLKEIISGSKVNSKVQLDLIFRRINNLRMKVIRNDSDIGEWGAETLFYHVLLGTSFIQDKNTEILEFKQIYQENGEIEYSYALFMPVTGKFSDSSYWLFFDKVAVASIDGPYKSTSKTMIEHYFKFLRDYKEYQIKSYEVEGDLLKDYIHNRDLNEFLLSKSNESLKTAKGLMGELIAYYYLARKHNAKLIDISKDIGSTDIDVIAENDEKLFLVQSKSSFPFTEQSVNELFSHFELVEKSVKSSKVIQRLLFLTSEEPKSDDETKFMDEKSLEGLALEEVHARITQVKKQLATKDIIICSYNDVRNTLGSKQYTKLRSRLDMVFDYSESDDEFVL